MKSLLTVLLLLQFGGLNEPPKRVRQWVRYAAEQQVVAAGKRGVLELRFAVERGFHVNSHIPRSELQIPTKVELEQEPSVKVGEAEYPAGKSYKLNFEGGETLDVYTDEFVVRVPVIAARGEHELKGALTYQACDKAACYPVKTLELDVVFTAK